MELIVCGPEDLDVLTSLYAQAVKYLESHVNYPKWHSDYPCRDSIRSCIQAGTQFICTENGCPVGATKNRAVGMKPFPGQVPCGKENILCSIRLLYHLPAMDKVSAAKW